MKRILTAAVLIPIVLLLIFGTTQHLWILYLAALLVAELAAWEFLSLADSMGARTPRALVLVFIAILFFVGSERPDLTGNALTALSLILFAVCAFRCPLDRVLPDAASSIFALIYVGYTLLTLPWLHAQENGPSLLTFLFCVVWAGDIAALYIGRTYGRRKLAPRLSPNKTWEGTIASVLGSVLITLFLVWLSTLFAHHDSSRLAFPGSIFHWIGLAILLNAAAQVGDLAESAIKRGAGVKDSGTLLPGHGGILDRIDALLLAAPLLWYAQLAQQIY